MYGADSIPWGRSLPAERRENIRHEESMHS